MTEACIVGWAHSPFGKLEDPDVESLIGRVAGAAIADAGIAAAEVDGVFVGNFNSGFSKQDFPSSLPMQSVPDLRFKPAARYENACASGSAAVYAARDFIAAGRGRLALVVGVEKMTATPGAQVGDNLLGASYRKEEGDIPGGFAGVFGRIAETLLPALGRPVGRAGRHRGQEPQERRGQPVRADAQDLGFEFCRTVSEKNPYVAGPLKRTDCSLVSDGAAALILADADTARAMAQVGALPRRRARQRLPAAVAAATRRGSRAARIAWARRWATPG